MPENDSYKGERYLQIDDRFIVNQQDVVRELNDIGDRLDGRQARIARLINNFKLEESTLVETEQKVIARVLYLDEVDPRTQKSKVVEIWNQSDLTILHGSYEDYLSKRDDYDGIGITYSIKTNGEELLVECYAPKDVSHKKWTLEQLTNLREGNLVLNLASGFYFQKA